VIASRFSTHRPSGALSRHISQYWLSLNNSAPIYTALPEEPAPGFWDPYLR